MKTSWSVVGPTVLILTLTGLPPAAAGARVFANCTALNKVYPGGVAKPGAVNQGGKTKYTPKYNAALYAANSSKDRDKDGIACEK